MTHQLCPNCQAEIKKTFLSDNQLIGEEKVDFINNYTKNPSSGFCFKCNKDLLKEALSSYNSHRNSLNALIKGYSEQILENSRFVPIVSLQTPQDWKYETIEIISAQTVTGTGVFTEIASNWTDFFGMESSRYNEILKSGEEKCKDIIRAQALKLGGNAILGTDIDYSEAGAGKGMLMVCMAGTAVKITNLNELKYNTKALNGIDELFTSINRAESELREIFRYKSIADQIYYES